MICAYCKRDRKLTREHIWPASIVKHVNDRFRYNEKVKKLFWADLVIKDVCESCNSVELSNLDSYGAKMYDRYLANYFDSDEDMKFEYNFQILAKWLPKLSFNAARAANSLDKDYLSTYANEIINPRLLLRDNFSIAVDLVRPIQLEGQSTKIFPSSNRICRVQSSDASSNGLLVRLVAVNSYYFWILFQTAKDSEIDKKKAVKFIEKIPGTRLDPASKVAYIRSSGVDLIGVHADWANKLRDISIPLKRNI